MSFFQKAPVTPEDFEQARPLEISPETVLTFDEKEWYAKAYRGDGVPQLTLRAVAMGTVLGFFLSFTNIYIGLKTGWFLGVNLTACILTFTIWTTLHKAGIVKTPMTILETNCTTSTASSAGYATGNTLVSAIPAMLLLSVGPSTPGGVPIPMMVIVPWVFLLAVLGVCLAIPMKRNMINQERLKFPSGTAAAVTLQGLYSSGKEALEKGRALMVGAAVGMLVPLLKDLNVVKHLDAAGKMTRDTLLPGTSNIFDWLPGITAAGKLYKLSDFTVKLDHSVVLVGAGAIIGLRVTVSMVCAGLFLAYFLGPLAMETSWHSPAGTVIAAATK
ncbi:MAG: OPT/YSL family transporter, partial [Polyangiaceae bacterium]